MRHILCVAGIVVCATVGRSADPKPPTRLIAGRVQAAYVDRWTAAFERPGVLAEVKKEGDQIESGTVVAALESAVAEAELSIAEARVAASQARIAAAQAQAESAQLELDFAKQANEKAAAQNLAPNFPEAEILKLTAALKTANAQTEEAVGELKVNEAAVKQAEAELRLVRRTCPISGLVTRVKSMHPGQAVTQGQEILEVVNTDRIRVEGYLSVFRQSSRSDSAASLRLSDLARLKVGIPVEIRLPADSGYSETERTIKGTLGFVDVDLQGKEEIRVWTEVDNAAGRLRAGMDLELVILAVPGSTPTANAIPVP